jgi:DNA-binding LacI/PurR family transcriptional regulator
MPTQKELAKLAGVSAGTVSNVISGTKKVSDSARQKVLDAIRTLDYRPNLIARSLKTNRTNTLGIVIPEITVPFFPKLIRGAESAARERGYFLIVVDSDADQTLELELISLLRSQRVDGILLVSAAGEWRLDVDANPKRLQPPIVCLDRLPEGLDVDSVSVDGRAAAEMGVAHLLSMGHKEIAIVTGPLSLRHEQERLGGYSKALQAHGIKLRKSMIWASTFEGGAIEIACQKGLLQSTEKPTALFTTNGVVALEVLRSIYALGMSAPEDIAFATLDEIAAADFFQPAITAVIQPTFDMGYRAVEVLLDRIAQQGESTEPRKNIFLPSTLRVRASSSLPRRSAAPIAISR